jgi:hypothetical protein
LLSDAGSLDRPWNVERVLKFASALSAHECGA